jgi:Spy/CpxP family protein refolding chaperone
MTSSSLQPKSGLRRYIAAVVIGLAGTVGLAAWAAQGGHPGHGGGFGGGPGMFAGSPERLNRMVDHMLRDVNATEAQRTQIKQIVTAAAGDLKNQREAGKALRERAAQLFTSPTVDANAAEALRQQMLSQHDQASKRMLQAMLDISRVLTPEQRTQLAERMQKRRDMMQRHRQERRELDNPTR